MKISPSRTFCSTGQPEKWKPQSPAKACAKKERAVIQDFRIYGRSALSRRRVRLSPAATAEPAFASGGALPAPIRRACWRVRRVLGGAQKPDGGATWTKVGPLAL